MLMSARRRRSRRWRHLPGAGPRARRDRAALSAEPVIAILGRHCRYIQQRADGLEGQTRATAHEASDRFSIVAAARERAMIQARPQGERGTVDRGNDSGCCAGPPRVERAHPITPDQRPAETTGIGALAGETVRAGSRVAAATVRPIAASFQGASRGRFDTVLFTFCEDAHGRDGRPGRNARAIQPRRSRASPRRIIPAMTPTARRNSGFG